MEGLMQSVVSRLKQAGVPAVRSFPGGVIPRITGPVAAVSMEKLQAVDGGFGRALGAAHGRQVQVTVLVRLFSPDSRGADAVCRALMQWPAVLTAELEEPVFDAGADCFVTCLRAAFKGLVSDAAETDEGPAFTDFRLEGEMK